MKKRTRSTALLIILLLAGAIVGSVLGEALKSVVPLLSYGKKLGLDMISLDMGVAGLTFGFYLNLNLAAVLGVSLAALLYQRM
ncbi:DUF4321 domain-containing protein [Thermosediminibacter oceani]|uniref:DUF4321 domain-containing protein n=1 Tax=Thermosediminibacter oceani (strain ATCC BAA-1034 / DSM 16646 / JW/IW-1228P) TaxID=555079 RepID=D9S276_THEOJ|nr:DUF4321 domain-containing protein [Thermosediminibacter oceani]ADL07503.1 conserved hypothetical protein [Thermosediminibacter oceani DSM 16646]